MRLDVNDHATGFLKFIEVAQARRVGGLLQRGAKGRDKLRTMMAHGIKLEMKYARCFPDGPKYAKLICSALLLESAPPLAFVFSEDSKLARIMHQTQPPTARADGRASALDPMMGRRAQLVMERVRG